MNFGKGKVVFIVMTKCWDNFAVMSCVGAFSEMSPALDYARQLMMEQCVAEELDHTEVEESDSQYAMVLSHEDSDYQVVIDYCADRTEEK